MHAIRHAVVFVLRRGPGHSSNSSSRGRSRIRSSADLARNLVAAFETLGAQDIQETMGVYLVPLRPATIRPRSRGCWPGSPISRRCAFAHPLPGDFAALTVFIANLRQRPGHRAHSASAAARPGRDFLDSPAISAKLSHIMVARGWTVDTITRRSCRCAWTSCPTASSSSSDSTAFGLVPVGVSGAGARPRFPGGIDDSPRGSAAHGAAGLPRHLHPFPQRDGGRRQRPGQIRRIVRVLRGLAARQPALSGAVRTAPAGDHHRRAGGHADDPVPARDSPPGRPVRRPRGHEPWSPAIR